MPEPGPFAASLGRIAFEFWQIAPALPIYLHIITAALFPIFTGAHASLCRPSSAADPKKIEHRATNDAPNDEDDSTDEEEDENSNFRMEGLSPIDAIVFPLLAGITLAGLYFLIQWLEDPQLLSKVLTWYFSLLGIFSVARLLSDSYGVMTSFVFPSRWSDGSLVWRFKNSRRRAESRFPSVESGPSPNESKFYRTHASPFPGLLSHILPSKVNDAMWAARIAMTEKWSLLARWRGKPIMRLKFGINDIAGLVGGLLVVGAYSLIAKSWWLTNLMGFGFSYGALQLISPTTFWTGTLVLMALFLYDIYFVFFTPMMVTVATSLDIPIKLLFPRPSTKNDLARPLAMLGLGDIILPGMMIGLALRFDLYMFYLRQQVKEASVVGAGHTALGLDGEEATADIIKPKYFSANGDWGERFWTRSHTSRRISKSTGGGRFPKPYFYSGIMGYVIGMLVTLGIMHFADRAQPALLYLVPGVLGALWGRAWGRGEIGLMWNFSEAEGGEETDNAMVLSAATDTGRAERTPVDSAGDDSIVGAPRDDYERPATVTSRSGAARRVKKDYEIFTLSLTVPSLNPFFGPTKASPKIPTLEDALREASELQIENPVGTPISAADFLSVRHRLPGVQRSTRPAEKRRRIV